MPIQRSSFATRMDLVACLVALALAFSSGSVQAQSLDVCGPTPAVNAALDQLPWQTAAQPYNQFHEQYVTALQVLMGQFPNDVFLERAYIRAMTTTGEKDQAIAEYKSRHEQNPDSVDLAYLYGLTLVGRESGEAIKLFTRALERDSKFMIPHLELVTIYDSPVFSDKGQRTVHLKAFLDACPSSLEGYETLAQFDDKELERTYAVKLRALLASRSDPDAIGAYSTLWSIEFKAHPTSEYDALRQQVARDLERLRQLKLENERQWYEALADGYNEVNDQMHGDWVAEQHAARFPSPLEDTPAMTKYERAFHGAPADDAPPATKHAYYSDLLAQTGEWLKDRPNHLGIWQNRLNAIDHLDDVSAIDVEAAVDQMYKVEQLNSGLKGLYPGYYELRTLSKKHFQPERVVALAESALTQWETESKEPRNDLYATKGSLDDNKFSMANFRLELLGYEIDGYLQLKEAEKAQVQLAHMEQWLQDMKLLVGDVKDRKISYYARLSSYWRGRACEAELYGHKLDAMAFYQNALLMRLEAQWKPATGEKDELADNARHLWSGLGGTEEGWQLWYGRRANELTNQVPLIWEEAHQPLPAFELADLNGKTWNLAALKGKTTFLNFWASW